MKLASLKHGRDGQLVVVSNDLAWCADAAHIAPTMQAALDDWDRLLPDLQNLATDLEHEMIPMRRFHEHAAAAPLPRAYALVRQARAAALPDRVRDDPLLYQGGSDGFLAPRDAIPLADEGSGCDFAGAVVVVTGDVPRGADRDTALAAVRLVGLANDVALRDLIPDEFAKGFGVFQSKPASAFSPVFVTPDALGAWWQSGKLHRKLMIDLNGQPFGRVEAGEDMTFDFGTLIAQAAKTRALGAGTIVGSGTVSNRAADGGPGKPIADGGVGYACLAEVRTVETILHGAAVTPFLKAGDSVRIWVEDDRRHAIFGTIEQSVGG